MAKRQITTKRRVALARQEENRRRAIAKRENRKRLIVGSVAGLIAVAMILGSGLALLFNNQSNPSPNPAPPPTTTAPPELPWIDPLAGGAQLVGATPCPATDGTAERTTSFQNAPPMCIADTSTHELDFVTDLGEFTLPVDAALAPEAANLAVTFARYRTYEGIPANTFVEGGLLWIGGDGDAGFTIPGGFETGEDLYPIGSVVMISGLDGALDGVIVVVLDGAAQAILQSDPRHVVIGHLDDLSEIRAIIDDLLERDADNDGSPAISTTLVTGVSATETG